MRAAALLIKKIKEKDKLITCFSFMQGSKFDNIDNVTPTEMKAICSFFEGCFINITDVRTDYGGKRNAYYVLEDELVNKAYMQGVDFIEM
jgi:hypothetical protein